MKRKIEEKLRAIELRRRGYSVNEIVKEVGVAKSSVSVWIRNVYLVPKARNRLLSRISMGQMMAAESKRKETKRVMDFYRGRDFVQMSKISHSRMSDKILCAIIYWCEGAKSHSSGVKFTNSDPHLVYTFLKLFRSAYNLDEAKFRICLHLHEYHNSAKQIAFWSKITRINPKQFMKPYLKPHTGKRIKDNYPGCVAIGYHSNDIAKQLLSTAQAFFEYNGACKSNSLS